MSDEAGMSEGSMSGGKTPFHKYFRWAFVLVPLVALWELVAHVAIVRGAPKPNDWQSAHAWIASHKGARDLVASAPVWTDPLARWHFGDLIPLRDAARADASTYTRALVATIRGGEHPDFAGWREEQSQRFGAVTVRVLRNPRPALALFDFYDQLHEARVFRVESSGPRECPLALGVPVTGGGLHQGPLAGPERFQCGEGWNNVSRIVLEDMSHRGRRCIWSHPVVDVPMRTVYQNVPIGEEIYGYHGIAYQAERGGDHGEIGCDVTLTVRVAGREVGRAVHHDGDGWRLFRFDTRALRGTRQEVSFEASMPSARAAHYCFTGDAR
ncbi:MAG: hypothetical protein Q8Q09_13605 [Deltaproteobacteria bacterium]|nr:hypothetical protein [Deltaproteobacteria bacterium]